MEKTIYKCKVKFLARRSDNTLRYRVVIPTVEKLDRDGKHKMRQGRDMRKIFASLEEATLHATDWYIQTNCMR